MRYPVTMTRSETKMPLKGFAWQNGIKVQLKVIHALMIRDALGRHGHEGLGFFWIVGEPLLLTCGIMALWSFAHLSHGEGVDVVPFALTGYTYITLWRHIVNKSVGSLKSNLSLRYFRQVKLLDLLIARSVLETLAICAAFAVAYLPLVCLDLVPFVRDPLPLCSSLLLIGWFSFGFGLILASLAEINEAVKHFIAPIMYITLPLTGVFTMQAWLPDNVRRVMLWSPLVNGIEMFRSGLFPSDVETYWSASYLFVCCITTTVVGLVLYSKAEQHVES